MELIVFDLDGTLLNRESQISAYTRDTLRLLAGQGVAIIMISSELPEVLGMADRIAVMRQGRMVQCLDRQQATQEEILEHAMEATVSP